MLTFPQTIEPISDQTLLEEFEEIKNNESKQDSQIQTNKENIQANADAIASIEITPEQISQIETNKNDIGTIKQNIIDIGDDVNLNTGDIADLESEKLDKISEQEKLYATNSQGLQTSIQYNVDPLGNDIPKRTADGKLKTTTPTESNDCVNKAYIDNLPIGSGTKVYVNDVEVESWNADTKADVDSIPTKTSELTNNSGFITKSVNDLTNYTNNTNLNATYAKKSEIPKNTSELTNNSGFIDSSALTGYAKSEDIPTNNNQLTNGAGYITKSVNDLTNYTNNAVLNQNYAKRTDIPTNNNQLANGAEYIKDTNLTPLRSNITNLQQEKVQRIVKSNIIYATDQDKLSKSIPYSYNADADSIPVSDSNGRLKTKDPSANFDCVNKQYFVSNIPKNTSQLNNNSNFITLNDIITKSESGNVIQNNSNKITGGKYSLTVIANKFACLVFQDLFISGTVQNLSTILENLPHPTSNVLFSIFNYDSNNYKPMRIEITTNGIAKWHWCGVPSSGSYYGMICYNIA